LKGISDIGPAACLHKPFELTTLVNLVDQHSDGAAFNGGGPGRPPGRNSHDPLRDRFEGQSAAAS
ncbi:MAG TPA: hypothetical protein VHS06_00365, partial [Chloroflexota bacterium]|nr:hypothetical protein [Chloroflexota bacterium]